TYNGGRGPRWLSRSCIPMRRRCAIVASGRPPIETLTPPEARVAYSASRAVLQPDPEPVAEVVSLQAAGPVGSVPLRLYRGQGAPKASPQPALIYFHG